MWAHFLLHSRKGQMLRPQSSAERNKLYYREPRLGDRRQTGVLILEGGRKMGRELRDDWWKVSLTFNGRTEFSAVLSSASSCIICTSLWYSAYNGRWIFGLCNLKSTVRHSSPSMRLCISKLLPICSFPGVLSFQYSFGGTGSSL